MYKYVLFDLDGTIADTSEGVFNATDYMIKKQGYRELSIKEKRSILGPPLWLSFSKFWGIEGKELDRAIELYREYYAANGLKQMKVYDGTIQLFENLKNAGITLLVATSKPNHVTPQVLDYLDITKYFTYVASPNPENESDDKSSLILDALKHANCKDFSEAIMIGDRLYDINGANKAGIDSIGITYGFGSMEELVEHGATFIAHNTIEIERIIKKW